MLVETAVVMPILLVLVLGTIDVTYMFYDWALANKAAYMGARMAVTSNPVDPAVADLSYTQAAENIGQSCLVLVALLLIPFARELRVGKLYKRRQRCLYQNFSTQCRCVPRLQRQNVTISYQTNGTGVVGQAWEGSDDPGNPQFTLPMNVTVSIAGMTHQFYFIAPLLQFFGGAISAAPAIPTFATTLQSEDILTN